VSFDFKKGRSTHERIRVLLVHDHPEPMGSLERALEEQRIETENAGTCHEANKALGGLHPPHLVFAAARLSDGSWQDIVLMAGRAVVPVNVIVVSESVDIPFYLEAIQAGAFDFIVPPMSSADFAYIVGSAIDNALRRRNSRSPAMSQAKAAETEEQTCPPRCQSQDAARNGILIDLSG
jgi:DNA-binding NtrC family response regulator